MKSLATLTTLFLLAMFCGCRATSSPPLNPDGEQAVQEMLTKNKIPSKLLSFHQTKGENTFYGGAEHFKMEGEAEIECTDDATLQGTKVQKGQHVTILVDIVFEKSGQDWKVRDVDWTKKRSQ